MLPASSHADRGLAARRGDAEIRLFICELCRVRAYTGADITPESRPLLELERARTLTRFNELSDDSVAALASSRRLLARLDAQLPEGLAPAL